MPVCPSQLPSLCDGLRADVETAEAPELNECWGEAAEPRLRAGGGVAAARVVVACWPRAGLRSPLARGWSCCSRTGARQIRAASPAGITEAAAPQLSPVYPRPPG